MSIYQKVMDLAKTKGLDTVTKICDTCDISAANWYRFRSSDKITDGMKDKLALGLKVSIGDINECIAKSLADDLKAKGELRPGEPKKEPKKEVKKKPAKEEAVKDEAAAEPVEAKTEEPEESSVENMPEAVKVEEAPAIDKDAVLECICNEVTKGYLPKPTYWDEIREQAWASDAIKLLVAKKMLEAITEDMKICVAEFEKTGEMCFIDQLKDDVIPALERAYKEVNGEK